MATDLYPHATHIVDIYHAREHLHDLAAHLAFITPDPPSWLAGRLSEPGDGDIEAIVGAARAYPLAGIKAEELDKKIGYFEHNIHRMRYAHFKKLGMFTGSGHIEAACKQIVVHGGSISLKVFPAVPLVGLSGREPVAEGDGEGVQCWLPSHGPPGLPGAGRVQGPGDEVEAL